MRGDPSVATELKVGIQVETEQLTSYMAFPDGEGPFPGVVIIHEIFGLNENTRDITRRFAIAWACTDDRLKAIVPLLCHESTALGNDLAQLSSRRLLS